MSKIYLFVIFYSSHVTFNVDSASAIQQAAHIQVITKNLYAQDGQRVPASYGVLDRRMVCICILIQPFNQGVSTMEILVDKI